MTDSEKEWQKVIYEREFANQKKRTDRLERELSKLRDVLNYKRGYEDGKRDAMKWISVKERLPEDGERVLTLDEYGDIRIEQYGEQEYDWLDDGTGLNSMTTTLYWMPLPEPPEVGE